MQGLCYNGLMRVEIDQSGKVEKTNLHTYLGLSNKQKVILKLSSTNKQYLQKHFRRIGKPRMFVYATFAALIVILIRSLKRDYQVVIDKEYPGKESLIRDLIKQYLPKFPIENLSFRQVGKRSKAHFLAYGAAIGKQKVGKVITVKEILAITKMRSA